MKTVLSTHYLFIIIIIIIFKPRSKYKDTAQERHHPSSMFQWCASLCCSD